MDDHRPSLDLLESTHTFPGIYQIKAIGAAMEDFEVRVLDSVISHLLDAADLDYTIRSTPGGRHVAITMHLTVQSAQQVRDIYKKLGELKGLTFLF